MNTSASVVGQNNASHSWLQLQWALRQLSSLQATARNKRLLAVRNLVCRAATLAVALMQDLS